MIAASIVKTTSRAVFSYGIFSLSWGAYCARKPSHFHSAVFYYDTINFLNGIFVRTSISISEHASFAVLICSLYCKKKKQGSMMESVQSPQKRRNSRASRGLYVHLTSGDNILANTLHHSGTSPRVSKTAFTWETNLRIYTPARHERWHSTPQAPYPTQV